MGAAQKFGPETIGSRFYLMPLSGRRRIALSAVAVLVLGCGVTSDSSPVAPSAVRAEVFTDPPLPGHAFVATLASGSMAVVTGEAEAVTTRVCGVEFNFAQQIGFVPAMSREYHGGDLVATPNRVVSLSTALIPPGVYPITLVNYCSPWNIFDVNFSHQ